ncbi:hypothetical protein KC346_g16985 [Hortaea werneckii]|nr:hypothetical protein KC346_g16985 [Hortaea werneckii]
MLRLRSRVGAPECIVRIRNWRLQSEKRMYRLLMEYCPYGDLADLVWNSVYSRARQRLDEQEDGKRNLPLWVPEPFIWSVFESLATAGLLMAKGELDANPGEPHWWEEIIHRDFKLANIFLGENLESRYRGYPSTKLGDFGLSLILRKDDNRTNEEFTGVGTKGARAPEQAHTYYARPSAATNVWGIGIIIWSLISLEETDETLDWDNDAVLDRIPEQGPEFDAIWARKKVPEIDKNAEQFYSKELVGLMRECLRFDPNMRISLLRLRRRIVKHAQDVRLTNGLRSAEKDNDGFRRDIRFRAQKWPLNGLARDVRGFPKGFDGMEKLPVPSSDGDSSDDDDLGGPRGAEIPVRGSQTAGQRSQERHESQAVAGEEGEDGERRRAEGEDANNNDGTQANQEPEGSAPGPRPPETPYPPPDPRLRRVDDRRSQAPEPPSPPPDPRLIRAGGRTPEAAEPLSPPPQPRSRVAGDRSPPAAEPLSPPPRPRSRVADDRPPPSAEPLTPPPRPRSRVAGDRPPRATEPPPPPPGLRPRLGRRRGARVSRDDAPAGPAPAASTAAAGAAAAGQQPRDENEEAAPPAQPRPSRAAHQPSDEDENGEAAPPPAPPPPRRARAGNRGGNAAAPPAPARVRGRAAGITRAAMRAAPPPPPPPPPPPQQQSGDEEEEEGEEEAEAAPRKGKGKGRAGTRGKGKRKRDEVEAEAEEEGEEEEEEEEVVERPRRRRRRRGGRGK